MTRHFPKAAFMTNSPTSLNQLVDDAIFLSTEAQSMVHKRWGGLSWSVDMERPSFSFRSTPPSVFRPHLLGTTASDPRSWTWGWSEQGGFPAATVAVADHIRTRGVEFGITELSNVALGLSGGHDLPLRLAIASKSLTGQIAHVDVDAGNGTRVWMLLEGPELTLPQPTVAVIAQTIIDGIGSTSVTDARRALSAYAAQRGISIEWTALNTANLTVADGVVQVRLDTHGRIAEVIPQARKSRSENTTRPQAATAPQHLTSPEQSTEPENVEKPVHKGFFGRLFGR